MNAIIVDDEPRAIHLLRSYVAHFKGIELLATFRNGIKAFEYITKEDVDLLFLDINMPHISGISLSKMLPNDIKVIFTTAYSEYAVESYEIQAVDYLVKPISLERFAKSMTRVLSSLTQTSAPDHPLIIVKSGITMHRLPYQQVLFLEKDSNYITYHCTHQKVIARETISEALGKLPHTFIQSHKSYIVNSEKVNSFDKFNVTIAHHQIPVSDSFREHLFHELSR